MSQQHRPFDNDDNDDQPSVIDNDNHGQGNLQRAALRSSTIGPTEHHPQHFSSVITSSNDHVEYSSNPTGVGTPSVSAYTPSQSYPHQEFHTYADEQVYYGYGRYADGDSQDTVMYMQSHSPPSRPAFFDDDEEEGEFVGGQTDGGHGAIVDDRHQSYHNSSHTFDQDPNNPLEGEDEDVSRTALFKSPPHFAVDVPDSDEDEVDSAADGMGIGTSFNRRPVHMPTNTTSSGAGPAVVAVADERASAIPPSLSRRTT
ncbi:hypothetical protein BDN72DRAFT_896388 [Pluteus cervinus]|uniref:Uncharacterized protein n=1 Tax=Pluteus cervinus TaxID=181527 RepID=A0ACD3AYP0_9AGAR|nr:hypothetical protein BDN72DRAFT_896388 [Pluteus cervinus]